MRSGRRSLGNTERRLRGGGGVLCLPFLQKPPCRPLEGFDVTHVDDASPELDGPIVLQAPEGPGHGLAVGPYHGAEVLVGVAGGYADLSGDLHPLALYEEEDEARKPRRHPLEDHVFHTGFVVVKALGEEAYHTQTHLRLLPYQPLYPCALHHEYYAGLHGPGERLPQAVGGEGHLSEDRPRLHHFEGELS